jgi:hypothetical protein
MCLTSISLLWLNSWLHWCYWTCLTSISTTHWKVQQRSLFNVHSSPLLHSVACIVMSLITWPSDVTTWPYLHNVQPAVTKLFFQDGDHRTLSPFSPLKNNFFMWPSAHLKITSNFSLLLHSVACIVTSLLMWPSDVTRPSSRNVQPAEK